MRHTIRGVSDWVDLQWSLLVDDLKLVAPIARGRLLDVGCGEKPYEAIFRPYVTEYIGIEHEATFALTSASGRGGPDLAYDGKTLPFPDASFDTILNVQVLEHTPDPQRLIDEMSRVLRRDGRLIVTAPFSFRLHEEPHDYFRYSPHGLRSMLGKAGLEVVDLHAHGGLFSVLAHKINTFLAFRLGRLEGMSQGMGKLGHERQAAAPPRYWALPVVLPTMATLSAGARVMDRAFPEPTEALSFLVVARKSATAA
ncbi:MAG: class I SAM-dependent methyltransferase [Myxococcota bacterium]|nr:class I SAM-dependent methyltransferase [Myxococcota bacterium]